jgi:alpha-L-rhamnosidase
MKNMKRARYILLLLLAVNVLGAYASNIKVVRLTCEYLEHPLGIGTAKPLLGWQCECAERGGSQQAYQIIVSDKASEVEHGIGRLWDSGKIQSSQCNNVEYKGKDLQSCHRYFWRVRIYDNHHHVSPWSDTSTFETALLSPQDWKAKWIGDGSVFPKNDSDFYKDDPAPIFRKVCRIDKTLASARLYISGLGYYDATINGQKIDGTVLDPGWTDYRQTILYSTYDITSLMREGRNVICVMLGNGYYNPIPMPIFRPLRQYLSIGRPKVIAQLLLSYTDGSSEMIPTDASWKVMYGPVLRNNVYLGEVYDARKEISTIGQSTMDDSRSANAIVVASPGGKMTAEMYPHIKTTATLKPVRMTEAHPGVFVYDMGQNFAGVARLHVRGPKGTVVRIRYGEDVYSDGSLNGMTSVAGQVKKIWGADRSTAGQPQTAYQQDTYILKGEGDEVWQPRFTFHGFRYVELTGFPGRPSLDAVEGIRLCSDLPRSGSFECSDEMINKIAKAVDWTFLSNVFSIQSDCPHREKLGYGGDISCTLDSYCYKFDMSNFHQNTVRNYGEARRPSGAMTETAPFVGIADSGFGDGSGPIGWQLAFCKTQQKLYEYYGNTRIIAENYDIFKRQVEFLRLHSHNNLISGDNCLGDHEALAYGTFSNTDRTVRNVPVSATAHYYYHVKTLAEFAQLLGRKDDEKTYSQLADDIKTAFIRNFCHDDGTIGTGSQSAQCFALDYHLFPDTMEGKIVNKLISSIHRANDHVHTGMFSTPVILNLLSRYGYSDLAYTMATNKDFPGWGYMMEHGATTIWETWHYSDNTYSQNHPMFGSVSEWFYRSLLGISTLSPAFQHVLIAPVPPTAISWARGSYKSISGTIAVNWKKENGHFILDVDIPFGTTARICLPNKDNHSVTESGKDIAHAEGITNVHKDGASTFADAVSGKYHFVVE